MHLSRHSRFLARLYAQKPTDERARELAESVSASLPPVESAGGRTIKRNALEVQTQTHLILLSFGKPVAAIARGGSGSAWQSETDWSLTTRRHICAWLRDHGKEPKKVPRVSGAFLAELLS